MSQHMMWSRIGVKDIMHIYNAECDAAAGQRGTAERGCASNLDDAQSLMLGYCFTCRHEHKKILGCIADPSFYLINVPLWVFS